MSEPKTTYTTAGDVEFYVKPTSNCEGLALTTLHALFGGTWSAWRYRADSITLRTGADLTPRFVVGWTDLYGGMACACAIYERIGDEDEPAWAIVGGNSGVRILANMDEHGDFEPAPGAEHLTPGWGAPVLLIEDGDDIVDAALREALNLDSDQPYSEPPDWSAPRNLNMRPTPFTLALAHELAMEPDAVAAALAAAASAVMVQLAEDEPQAISLLRSDGGVVIGTTEQVGDVWLSPGAVATLRGLLLMFDESLELTP